MSEPALKCENNFSFKQIYTLKLFIAFKMAYYCCFSLGGNPDFPEFLKKSFITSTTGLLLLHVVAVVVMLVSGVLDLIRSSSILIALQNNELMQRT